MVEHPDDYINSVVRKMVQDLTDKVSEQEAEIERLKANQCSCRKAIFSDDKQT